MPASVELSVERLLGVLGVVVARERGDPNSVRVCAGRYVEQQRHGHWQVAAGPPDAAHFNRPAHLVWVGQISIEHLSRGTPGG